MSLHTPETACHPSGDSFASICVLGIGNLLWADEGFGVRCIEAVQRHYEFAPHVSLIDGGTQGLYLVQFVQAADALLIFDAIDYGLEPGTLKLVRDDDVPRFMGAKKMSLHQTGFQEVLSLAQLTEQYPKRVLLIGCQPQELDDYGGSLRPVVRQSMDEAIALAIQELTLWGAQPRTRTTPLSERETVTMAELALAAYETQRPDAQTACRDGDARFFPSSHDNPKDRAGA